MKKLLKEIKIQFNEVEKREEEGVFDVCIEIPMKIGWIEDVNFYIEDSKTRKVYRLDHIKNENGISFFSKEITIPTKAIYHYYFSLEANNHFLYLKKENQEHTESISKDEMWKMSVNFSVPDWAKGKVMYHIFLDRFHRGGHESLKEMKNRTIHSSWEEEMVIGPDKDGIWNADFYGGNIQGIIDKLDYIESLGASILYLSPIVWSQSNHRYDTADYEQVDPYAGTNEDLRKLCEEAHKKGMKVILDGVFNHTGNDSKYFNQFGNFPEVGAYQSKDSKYFPFFRSYVSNNKTYFDYWWGMKNLPVCDGKSKAWQEYIYGEGGIIDLWFSLGIDGLRLDVADELTDEFIEGIRKAVKRNKKDGFILGEVWKNPMRMSRGYIESGKCLDSVMNYPLMDALIRYFKYEDVEKLREILRQIETEYPEDTILSLMNFTSTHDITRAINIFGTKEFQYNGEWAWNLMNEDRAWQASYQMSPEGYERGKEIYKAYLYCLTFLPGNLSIFYGDEVGLQGMGNLSNRKPFPWKHVDPDLLKYVQWLGMIRKQEPTLEKAHLRTLEITPQLFCFERDSSFVIVNRSSERKEILLPESYREGRILYPLRNSTKESLDAHGAVFVKKKEES